MATILVCTQQEDLLAELLPVLRSNHRVALVAHAADAIRWLLLHRFEAVVLDVAEEMPERLDALPVISRLNPRVPTLAVCGQTSGEVEAGLRGSGICCLLLRPLIPGELERHLTAALRWRAPAGPPSPSRNDATPVAAR